MRTGPAHRTANHWQRSARAIRNVAKTHDVVTAIYSKLDVVTAIYHEIYANFLPLSVESDFRNPEFEKPTEK